MGWQFAGESHLPRGVPGQKLLPYGPDLCMIKDAIANIARDCNLPSFPATTASKISVISEALSECAASARNSISFKKGLGTVDVNVLYHSLFELASPPCPGRFPTDLLDLSSKESSNPPVAFQKEACHYS